MRLALDTDVLIAWTLAGATRNALATALIERERRASPDLRIVLVPQVMFEFIHVVTDPRRFEVPLSVPTALRRAEALWTASDVERVLPDTSVVSRTTALLQLHGLGRKRILDTALAATLEAAKVRHLATFNGSDFALFEFLKIVTMAEPT